MYYVIYCNFSNKEQFGAYQTNFLIKLAGKLNTTYVDVTHPFIASLCTNGSAWRVKFKKETSSLKQGSANTDPN